MKLKIVNALWSHLRRANELLDRIDRKLDYHPPPVPPPAPPPPYVAVLVQATRVIMNAPPERPLSSKRSAILEPSAISHVEPITFGKSIELHKRNEEITFRAWFPMRAVQIVVLADLRQVRVRQMILGIESLTVMGDSCPIARIAQWDVAIDLAIYLERIT